MIKMNILKEGEHNIVDLSLSTFREIGDVCMTDKFVYIDSDDINSYNERYTPISVVVSISVQYHVLL